MRNFFAVALLGLGVAVLGAAPAFADTIEVKGPHICCKQCVNVAQGLLAKIEGVSDAKADAKTKTVTFTAKDVAAAKAGVAALFKGGFSGKATRTSDGKELIVDLPAVAKGDKAAAVVVKDVHVCCGQCQTGIKALFEGAKITFEGKGPQRTVRIEGAELYPGAVIDALRKGGFNGTLEK